MLGILLIGCSRQMLFYPSLNFSPDCPHPAAKFASSKTTFARLRLIIKTPTCSKKADISVCAIFGMIFDSFTQPGS
jgi:hypothetical protein